MVDSDESDKSDGSTGLTCRRGEGGGRTWGASLQGRGGIGSGRGGKMTGNVAEMGTRRQNEEE